MTADTTIADPTFPHDGKRGGGIPPPLKKGAGGYPLLAILYYYYIYALVCRTSCEKP